MNTSALMTVRQFEELTINTWPSLQTCCYDGWILRFARGYTRRANSVYPLYDSSIMKRRSGSIAVWIFVKHTTTGIESGKPALTCGMHSESGVL
jgi:hypothetical protein